MAQLLVDTAVADENTSLAALRSLVAYEADVLADLLGTTRANIYEKYRGREMQINETVFRLVMQGKIGLHR